MKQPDFFFFSHTHIQTHTHTHTQTQTHTHRMNGFIPAVARRYYQRGNDSVLVLLQIPSLCLGESLITGLFNLVESANRRKTSV